MKFVCDYDLPVRQNITIQVFLKIKDEKFSIKGKMIRKEEHLKNNYIAYGIRFIETNPNEVNNLPPLISSGLR